jgi:anti-sigma B factor antagonist
MSTTVTNPDAAQMPPAPFSVVPMEVSALNSFRYRTSRLANTVVVEVDGELDMLTAPELEQAIDSASAFAPRVAVDISGVAFLDTSAIRTLVHCKGRLSERRIAFHLVVPPNHRLVRQTLEITGLTTQLGVVDSLEEAVA